MLKGSPVVLPSGSSSARPTGGPRYHARRASVGAHRLRGSLIPPRNLRHRDLGDDQAVHDTQSPRVPRAPHTVRVCNGDGKEVERRWDQDVQPRRPEAMRPMDVQAARPRPASARTMAQPLSSGRPDTPGNFSLVTVTADLPRVCAQDSGPKSYGPKIYTADPVWLKHESYDKGSPASASTFWGSSDADDSVYQACSPCDDRRCAMQVVKCPRGGACWVPDSPKWGPRKTTNRTFDSSLMQARFGCDPRVQDLQESASVGARVRPHSARR